MARRDVSQLRMLAYRAKRWLTTSGVRLLPEPLRYCRWTNLDGADVWPPLAAPFLEPRVHYPANHVAPLRAMHRRHATLPITLPQATVHEFVDGVLFVESGMIADRHGALVREAAKPPYSALTFREPGALRRPWIPRSGESRACSTVLLGSQSRNWYHWLVDCLPRLYGLSLLDEEVVLLLPRSLAGSRLEALQIARPDNVVLKTIDEKVVRCHRLILTPTITVGGCGLIRPEAFQFLRNRFARRAENHAAPFAETRVYLSRAGRGVREIGNEGSLVEALRPLGFRAVNPGDLSFADQVAMFARAEVLVGLHGANLTGILFTDPARVLEIYPMSLNYYGIAVTAGARYEFVLHEESVGPSSRAWIKKFHGQAELDVNVGPIVAAAQRLCETSN